MDVLGVLTVLDTSTAQAQAQDRYVDGTVLQQIQDARLLLLNKVDLAAPADLANNRAWLAELNPRASVFESSQAALPPDFWGLLKGSISNVCRRIQ